MNNVDCCHERRGIYSFLVAFSRFNVARLANEQWNVLQDDYNVLRWKDYDSYYR